MSRSRSETLALVARVARVRELQAQQKLAAASEREREQKKRVDAADGQVADALSAIASLQECRRLDLPRIGLLHAISSHVDQVLQQECGVLSERRAELKCDADDVQHKARYRECVDERVAKSATESRLRWEERRRDLAIGDWLGRKNTPRRTV